MTQKNLSRLLRSALVVSLAFNLLLVGLIVGSASRAERGQGGLSPQLGPIGQLLPQEDRAKIGRDIQRELRGRNGDRRERAAALSDIIGHLEAAEFDPVAFTATFEMQQSWQDEVRGVALAQFVAHVSAMSQVERAAIATALREQATRRGQRGGRPPGGGQD